MNKYIDADLLREKIAEQMKSLPREVGRGAGTITAKGYGMMEAFQIVRSIIDSLQQEQSEVDLAEEVEEYFQGYWPGMETAEQCNTDLHFTPPSIMRMIEHFYEFGLNARKENSHESTG